MLRVVARTLVKAECTAQYLALAGELVAETQKEAGHISYTLNQSTENPQLFAMIEVWADKAALDAHMATDHFRRIVPQLAAYAEEKYPLELFNEVAPAAKGGNEA